MLYQRKWLGQSTYWVGKKKFDTKEAALSSLGLDLFDKCLYSPWCSIDLADREIHTINEAIDKTIKIIRENA